MTPRKSLLQIAIVLSVVSGASALLAQRAPEDHTPSPIQTAGVAAKNAPIRQKGGISIKSHNAVAAKASRPVFQAEPMRLAQAIEPGVAQPKGEISALELQAATRREKSARDFMTARGFSDKATQDAIIGYLQEQESAREALAEAGRSLAPALTAQEGGGLTDAQVEILVDNYQTQLKAYGRQNQQKQANLDAKIGFSKKPRLQAMLLLMGALDQGPRILPVWRPLRPEGVLRPRQPKPAV